MAMWRSRSSSFIAIACSFLEFGSSLEFVPAAVHEVKPSGDRELALSDTSDLVAAEELASDVVDTDSEVLSPNAQSAGTCG